jgi:DNA-binding transcriptional LysR family regulator
MINTPHSWDDLRLFLHIGRAGSLMAAAGTLRVSHATVFRRLQQLEAELGVRLFERSRAGYALTSAGQELMQVAADMEIGIASATRRLGSRDAWPGGVVRLTTTDTLMHAALAPILCDYQRASGVQLLINTSTVQQDILKGEADVAIRAGGRPADPLVARRLCRIESTVYRSRKIGGVTPENLADFPWIAGDWQSKAWTRKLCCVPIAMSTCSTWSRPARVWRCFRVTSETWSLRFAECFQHRQRCGAVTCGY